MRIPAFFVLLAFFFLATQARHFRQKKLVPQQVPISPQEAYKAIPNAPMAAGGWKWFPRPEVLNSYGVAN